MTSEDARTSLLQSIRVLEIGPGLAGAVCGHQFAQLGADVVRVETPATDEADPVRAALNAGKRAVALDPDQPSGREAIEALIGDADLVVIADRPAEMERRGLAAEGLRAAHPRAVVACITPFGLTGPYRDYRGGDLVAFHASGVARLLMGPVADPDAEPPVRAAGEQSHFIAGVTAACASMQALYEQQASGRGRLIDVSAQEALACMAVRELAQPAYGKPSSARLRVADGNGATVTILPASDGFVAISPREERQWQAWLGVMGEPGWGAEARFADRAARVEHWDALHALMSEWSTQRRKAEIYEAAQAAHVPCFPLSTAADLLSSPQLAHRRFFRALDAGDGEAVAAPGPPYGLPDADYGALDTAVAQVTPEAAWRPRAASSARRGTSAPGRPLEGVRVLDFSWVIAGPTCTRYLAAMGAEVLKVETAARPDPGRASELHAVLGQGKAGLALNMRAPEAAGVARRLVAESDVVVENFATGVMERFGLGYEVLRDIRPGLVMLSASGLGRTGPDAEKVAYGTLLQCYTGFAGLNGYPERPPAVGMAWLDPLCGLMMAFAVTAALHDRRATGGGRHIDFSMVEALLSTMPGPLLAHQLGGPAPQRAGNGSAEHSPHGVYACRGEDAWVAVAVTSDDEWRALCRVIEPLREVEDIDAAGRRRRAGEIDRAIGEWTRERTPREAMDALQAAGISAASSFSSTDLFDDPHLRARGFYREVVDAGGVERRLPGLPWRWGDGLAAPGPAPQLGADTDRVLREVLGLTAGDIDALREAGALT